MKLIKFLSIIIVALVIFNVTLTNRSVDESLVVSGLNKEIISLQNQNTILRSEVAEAGSLGNIRAKLADSGFVASPKVVSVQTTSSVASR